MKAHTKSNKWLIALFYFILSLLFAFLIHKIFTFDMSFDEWRASYRNRQLQHAKAQKEDKSIITVNAQKTIGNVKITYRGLDGQAILFEFIIAEMDPDYRYVRRLPIKEATQGFYLATQYIRLISASPYKMEISDTP